MAATRARKPTRWFEAPLVERSQAARLPVRPADAPPNARSSVFDVVGRGGGRPLDDVLRRAMEERLGEPFETVRVHIDARSTESVGAEAYTVGEEIVIHPTFARLTGVGGRKLLAHELAHVIQQRHGPVDGTPAPGGINLSEPSDRFEQAADHVAEAALAGETANALPRVSADAPTLRTASSRPASPTRPTTDLIVQRKPCPRKGGAENEWFDPDMPNWKLVRIADSPTWWAFKLVSDSGQHIRNLWYHATDGTYHANVGGPSLDPASIAQNTAPWPSTAGGGLPRSAVVTAAGASSVPSPAGAVPSRVPILSAKKLEDVEKEKETEERHRPGGLAPPGRVLLPPLPSRSIPFDVEGSDSDNDEEEKRRERSGPIPARSRARRVGRGVPSPFVGVQSRATLSVDELSGKGYVQDSRGFSLSPGYGYEVPPICWKAHVAATSRTAPYIMAVAHDVLSRYRYGDSGPAGVQHKFYVSKPDSEKFVTIYPPRVPAHWPEVIAALETALQGIRVTVGGVPVQQSRRFLAQYMLVGAQGVIGMRFGGGQPLCLAALKEAGFQIKEIGSVTVHHQQMKQQFELREGEQVKELQVTAPGKSASGERGPVRFPEDIPHNEPNTAGARGRYKLVCGNNRIMFYRPQPSEWLFAAILLNNQIVPDFRDAGGANPYGQNLPEGVSPYEPDDGSADNEKEAPRPDKGKGVDRARPRAARSLSSAVPPVLVPAVSSPPWRHDEETKSSHSEQDTAFPSPSLSGQWHSARLLTSRSRDARRRGDVRIGSELRLRPVEDLQLKAGDTVDLPWLSLANAISTFRRMLRTLTAEENVRDCRAQDAFLEQLSTHYATIDAAARAVTGTRALQAHYVMWCVQADLDRLSWMDDATTLAMAWNHQFAGKTYQRCLAIARAQSHLRAAGYHTDRVFLGHGQLPSQRAYVVPSEGRKIHLSVDASSVPAVVNFILPLLARRGYVHKFVVDLADLEPDDAAGRADQRGKVVTIYPKFKRTASRSGARPMLEVDESDLENLADSLAALAEAYRLTPGPVPSQARSGDTPWKHRRTGRTSWVVYVTGATARLT
jgi:Domain of unknown function (DUF4157)